MKTFYWHDYETWGTAPAVDRASQFAGVRTDEQLNIISDPLIIHCRPPDDIWPHPDACLVTGITPQEARAKGLNERDFIAQIHHQLVQPETCGVGYNTLRFDDEVTRYALYRNFYDPYEREWKNGNSRWDIIDMVRLVYALRPGGIEWPTADDKPSFRLENLTAANGIAHTSAHDAYSDVEATIKLARLIKQKKPELYQYVLNNRSRKAAAAFIDIDNCKPLLHISSKFPSTRGCAGLIAPLAMHPVNKNAVIVFDLSVDPSPMASLTAEQIRERVFVSQETLGEDVSRLPVKLVHLNKCPVLATAKLLDQAVASRLGIDKARCDAHWQTLKHMSIGNELQNKLKDMYKLDKLIPSQDPECQLYNGFVGDRDKHLMATLRRMDAEALATTNIVFEDARLNGLLLPYKARNFYSSLSAAEQAQWREMAAERLAEGSERHLSYSQYQERLAELSRENSGNADKLTLIQQLKAYGEQHMAEFEPRVR